MRSSAPWPLLAIVAALVVVPALAVPTASAETPKVAAAAPCPTTGRTVIRILGTGSTGDFDASEDFVLSYDPASGDQRIFEYERDSDYPFLLGEIGPCTVLTLSYDGTYLPLSGTSTPGKHAWNKPTSPWDVPMDEAADRLRELIAVVPTTSKVDIVAYSAGGAVATYWATRDASIATSRVHSIIAVDGVVSGVDHWIATFICVFVPGSLRHLDIDHWGRFPCHFRAVHEQRIRVVQQWPAGLPLATVRTHGDEIVHYEWAGLPGVGIDPDPPLQAEPCPLPQWPVDYGKCMVRSHRHVLRDPGAKTAIEGTISR